MTVASSSIVALAMLAAGWDMTKLSAWDLVAFIVACFLFRGFVCFCEGFMEEWIRLTFK